jgi:hypothetical protein
MNHALHFFALTAVLAYAIVIFMKDKLTANQFIAADMLMGAALVALIVKGKYSPLVFVSLLWLVANYMTQLPTGDVRWYAYDGFAVASVLSQIPLSKLL